ncbi:MAG: hypothetical protein COB15_16485 [Flavobacteriales bacterium]|nr:MAG: hypothetical protein COB15_16485 [Flavobacteriales bacterium]
MLKPIFIILCLFCNNLIFSQQKDAPFTLCDDGSVHPYYHPELKYKGGFWEIKQHFQSTYSTAKFQVLKNNSGIVTVQFNVNCKGETGDFKIRQCDLDYQPITLNKKITDYLMTKTIELKDWIIAKDEDGKIVNSQKFFSFRIKEGILLEILPK